MTIRRLLGPYPTLRFERQPAGLLAVCRRYISIRPKPPPMLLFIENLKGQMRLQVLTYHNLAAHYVEEKVCWFSLKCWASALPNRHALFSAGRKVIFRARVWNRVNHVFAPRAARPFNARR